MHTTAEAALRYACLCREATDIWRVRCPHSVKRDVIDAGGDAVFTEHDIPYSNLKRTITVTPKTADRFWNRYIETLGGSRKPHPIPWDE